MPYSEATRAKAANYQAGAPSVDEGMRYDRVRTWIDGMQAFKEAYAAPEPEPRDPCPPVWQWRKRRRWMLAARIAELEVELGLTVR